MLGRSEDHPTHLACESFCARQSGYVLQLLLAKGVRARLDDLSCYGLACLVLLPVQGLQAVWAEPGQGNEASEAIHIQHHTALVD